MTTVADQRISRQRYLLRREISRLTADNEAERAAMDVTQRRAIAAEARADALAQEVERQKGENGRLRNVVSKVCAALPNGAFCSPECSIEFMEEVPGEVAGVIAALANEEAGR